ncbi:MAG: methyltransferase domain-containing protein [Planctomycetes bacterium]|nr:methyltransferase domain-containing protein [Planctomycetota bacterium]
MEATTQPPAHVTQAWRAYWDAHGGELGAEPPAYLRDVLLHELSPAPGMRILEAGCGTGGLSRALADAGAHVTMIDIVAACVFQGLAGTGPRAAGVNADLFRMPFADGSFDVVWNSGVMEHFEPDQLARGLAEMARVLRPGGRLVVIVPSKRGRYYVRGKRRMERAGKWEYGVEHPQGSLAPLIGDGLALAREYEVGVRWQTRFLDGWRRTLAAALTRPFSETSRVGAALFGGYLLVSSWTKNA